MNKDWMRSEILGEFEEFMVAICIDELIGNYEMRFGFFNSDMEEYISKAYDEFKEKEESRPWVIELDPTTACNLACHGCISANLLNQGGFKRDRIKIYF